MTRTMCSMEWDDSGLPAYGTAAVASFWVGLEQNGPWGHTALVESRLDARLGRRLEQACASAGGRLLLVRRPGAHADAAEGRRTVLVAGGLAAQPWLVEAQVDGPEALLGLPLADLATGSADLVVDVLGGQVVGPAFLVCTNGKRDVCCAVRGRPVAAAAADLRPGHVWECSHTGGHRFAPTGILLPTGQTLGRVDVEQVVRALDEAAHGRLVAGAEHDRGLSHLDPVVQAAEAWLRDVTGITAIGGIRPGEPRADGPGLVVPLTAGDGEWQVRVERMVVDEQRKDSCAKDAVPSATWRVSPL